MQIDFHQHQLSVGISNLCSIIFSTVDFCERLEQVVRYIEVLSNQVTTGYGYIWSVSMTLCRTAIFGSFLASIKKDPFIVVAQELKKNTWVGWILRSDKEHSTGTKSRKPSKRTSCSQVDSDVQAMSDSVGQLLNCFHFHSKKSTVFLNSSQCLSRLD